MPDPSRETISASEAPALFNASPYMTRFMLYQKFANGMVFEKPSDERMEWGTAMQPLIVKRVAEDRKLQAYPNVVDEYVRRDRLGCTRDAIIIDPDRGPGALEIKCVFDYEQWGRRWGGGDAVPRDYELQLQTQMLVGDGDGASQYKWGLIAVWVCAKMYYFERKPIADLWEQLVVESELFFLDVGERREPDPFGVAVESKLLRELYPTRPDSTLDLSTDPDAVKVSEQVSMFKHHKELATGNQGCAEELRLKLLAFAKDYHFVKLPCGVSYRVQKSGKGQTIVPYIPDAPLPPPPPRTVTGII